MSYKIYQTEGFVVSNKALKEEDAVFSVLTPDLGLIWVNAKSVRSMRSKLKPHLTTYSHIELSLVRGKEAWRVITAQKVFSAREFLDSEKKRLSIARVFQLVNRLIAGESENHDLFLSLVSFTRALSLIDPNDMESLKNYEAVMVLRLLNHTGYLEEVPILKTFTASDSWESSFVRAIAPLQKTAIKTINESFNASQL